MKRTRKSDIESFFSSPAIAVVGASPNAKKFGNSIFRALKEKGKTAYPVNPRHSTVDGDRCYPSVLDLPDNGVSVLTVVPPAETEKVVSECRKKGITRIWMQPGSTSQQAIKDARDAGMTVITGECPFMFLEPVASVHGVHRFFKKMVGAYPR